MFSLNRFEYDFTNNERHKLTDRFTYPVTLDMAPYIERPTKAGGQEGDKDKVMYDLSAVVIHQVRGEGGR